MYFYRIEHIDNIDCIQKILIHNKKYSKKAFKKLCKNALDHSCENIKEDGLYIAPNGLLIFSYLVKSLINNYGFTEIKITAEYSSIFAVEDTTDESIISYKFRDFIHNHNKEI